MGNQWSKQVDPGDVNEDFDNIYTEPYTVGYNEPYDDIRIQEQELNDIRNPTRNADDVSQTERYEHYEIENAAYESDIEISASIAPIPTLHLIFIVQNDEKDSQSCTLRNKKIFLHYLNKFSIDSRKIDIQLKQPIFLDRNLGFDDTKQFISDKLNEWKGESVEKVEECSKMILVANRLRFVVNFKLLKCLCFASNRVNL